MTLEATPSIVSPSGIAGLTFRDEADTVNALVPRLRARGAETVIVLLHEGGVTSGGPNECPNVSGPIVDVVERTSDEVDLFVTGHTHRAYSASIDGRPVTSAGSFGRLLTRIDLSIDGASGEPTRVRPATSRSRATCRGTPVRHALLERYRALAAPIAGRVVGRRSAAASRATPTPPGSRPWAT